MGHLLSPDQIISSHPDVCLLIADDALARVTKWALEQVASDDVIAADETTLFGINCLVECGCFGFKEVEVVAWNIRLDQMKASNLEIVSLSGLVKTTQVWNMFKTLATRAETAGFGASSVVRGGRWETTKSTIFQPATESHGSELLQCQPMHTGKYQWPIEVLSLFCEPMMFLGLACSSAEIDKTLVLFQHGRAWRNNGETFHAHKLRKNVGVLVSRRAIW